MEFTFDRMGYWPDRDASWYFAVDVIDADVRYPVRIMIDGLDLLRCKHEIPDLNEDIIKTFYRQELEALARAGRLNPDSARTMNVVFCVDGRREQVRDGDVVIDGTCDKLKTIAAGQGKPTP